MAEVSSLIESHSSWNHMRLLPHSPSLPAWLHFSPLHSTPPSLPPSLPLSYVTLIDRIALSQSCLSSFSLASLRITTFHVVDREAWQQAKSSCTSSVPVALWRRVLTQISSSLDGSEFPIPVASESWAWIRSNSQWPLGPPALVVDLHRSRWEICNDEELDLWREITNDSWHWGLISKSAPSILAPDQIRTS